MDGRDIQRLLGIRREKVGEDVIPEINHARLCRCGNLVSCVCDIKQKHKETCRFRMAASLGVELPCEHGLQACPECDPCSCGAGSAFPVS